MVPRVRRVRGERCGHVSVPPRTWQWLLLDGRRRVDRLRRFRERRRFRCQIGSGRRGLAAHPVSPRCVVQARAAVVAV